MRTSARKPRARRQNARDRSGAFAKTRIGPVGRVNAVLRLQRTVGNRATRRLLQVGDEDPVMAPRSSVSAGHLLPVVQAPVRTVDPTGTQTGGQAREPVGSAQQHVRPGSMVMRQFDWIEPALETGDAAQVAPTQVSDELLDQGVKAMEQKAALERGKKELEKRKLASALFGERNFPYDPDVHLAQNTALLEQQKRYFDSLERKWQLATAKKHAVRMKGLGELRQPGGTVGYAAYKLKNALFGGGREDPKEALLWMKVGNMLGGLLGKKTTPAVRKPGYSKIRYRRR